MLFQITGGQEVYLERVALALGWSSAVFALATVISCRSFVTLTNFLIRKNPMKIGAYQSFYKYHSYYWWVFGVSIVAHITTAVSHTGLPAFGDPDALTHLTILLVGFGGVLSNLVVFFSCRICTRLLAPFMPKSTFQSETYKLFFKYHSYIWWVFGALVAGHITAAFLHVGLWVAGGK